MAKALWHGEQCTRSERGPDCEIVSACLGRRLSTGTLPTSEGAAATCRTVCLAAACAPCARRLTWEQPHACSWRQSSFVSHACANTRPVLTANCSDLWTLVTAEGSCSSVAL